MCLTTAMVGRPVPGAQARQVVVRHHVEHPMQPVLKPPVAAHHASERLGIEFGRAKVIASFPLKLAVPLGLAFDHAEHGKSWECWLARVAAFREQPIDLVTDSMRTGFDPAVVAINGSMQVDGQRRRRRPRTGLGPR